MFQDDKVLYWSLLMKSKVIFLSYCDLCDSSARAARVKMYSKMLDNEGIENKYYSIYDFYNESPLIGVLNSNRYIRRFSYYFTIFAYVKSMKKYFSKECDTVFYLYPTTAISLDYFLIIYLKILNNQKIFLEVNEVRKWGGSVKEKSFSFFKYKLYERLSRNFTGLVCISKNIEAYYKKYNTNTLRIPILSNANIIYTNNCNYQKGRAFNIGFMGSIHIEKENLDIFFSALNQVSSKGYCIVFNMYGSISDKKKFYELVEFYSLKSIIKYHGVVEQNLIPSRLAIQDLLVLPRARTPQNMYGFSTKLSEYLVSGVPVLITDVSDNLVYLTPNEDCIIADFKSSKNFASQIESLITNYDSVAEKLAQNAFNVARKNFHYLTHSSNFKVFLEVSN